MIAVKLGGAGDVTKTHLAWEKDRATPYVPCLLAHRGYLYSINDKGVVSCYETKSGKEIWVHRLGVDVTSSPLLIDGKVYIIGEKGDVFVLEASPIGYKRLAKNRLGELVYATPAVANGRLYIRGGKHLFCIGKPSATEK